MALKLSSKFSSFRLLAKIIHQAIGGRGGKGIRTKTSHSLLYFFGIFVSLSDRMDGGGRRFGIDLEFCAQVTPGKWIFMRDGRVSEPRPAQRIRRSSEGQHALNGRHCGHTPMKIKSFQGHTHSFGQEHAQTTFNRTTGDIREIVKRTFKSALYSGNTHMTVTRCVHERVWNFNSRV